MFEELTEEERNLGLFSAGLTYLKALQDVFKGIMDRGQWPSHMDVYGFRISRNFKQKFREVMQTFCTSLFTPR
jgi:hypothetical protein